MLMYKNHLLFLLMAILLLSIAGCGISNEKAKEQEDSIETFAESTKLSKQIDLINRDSKKVGTATLTQTEHGVLVHVSVSGLKPGEHGFHVHETAKCEAPTFESAGGHFNPTDKQHGFNNPKGFHAGDMANVVVDQNGNVNNDVFIDYISLKKGEQNSLLDKDGSSLMIHAGPDDYVTDPAGNSGERIVCGVIK